MDYRQAISHLITLVDAERNRLSGPRQKAIYNLARMEGLLERLGHPHRRVPSIHVAGTKGKGSTSALCDSVLHAAGLSTGFYSSPHLHSFCERIRRDGEPITPGVFAALVQDLWPMRGHDSGDPVTLFEFMTGMAFHCFDQAPVDVQTIEVGLGGRLDATNVVDAVVCVITSVSLDHTQVLGDTVGEIAADKSGIIKDGATAVIAPQSADALAPILDACNRRNANAILVGRDVTWEATGAGNGMQSFTVQGLERSYDLEMPLLGDYQLENAATAVAALESLARVQGFDLPGLAFDEGFRRVSWPCRMETLSRRPLLVADGAHNVYSMDSLLRSLPKYFDFDRLVVIAGFSRDKAVDGMAESLGRAAQRVFTAASRHPRSLNSEELAGLFEARGIGAIAAGTPREALTQAMAGAGERDLVLATGSLFLAAEVRETALGIEPEVYPELLTGPGTP